MSMSMRVIGLAGNGEHHQKMLAVIAACDAAGVAPPADVLTYFADTIAEYGEISTEWAAECQLERKIPNREWSRDMSVGIEVSVKDIPADVTTLRFYCSY